MESGCGAEGLKLGTSTLLAPEHHQHIEVAELARVRLVGPCQDLLNDQQPATVSDGIAAAAKNRRRRRVVPVVNDVLQQVGISFRDRLEEAAADDLAALRDTGLFESRLRGCDDMGLVKEDALQLWIGLENGREERSVAAPYVAKHSDRGEVV